MINSFLKEITEERIRELGFVKRKIVKNGVDIYVFYLPQISNRMLIGEDIIKPIVSCEEEKELTIDNIAKSVIYFDDIRIEKDSSNIIYEILTGQSVIIVSNEEKCIVLNTIDIQKRGVNTPEIQNTLRGSKDAFTENFDTNLSLIRYRLKDDNLRVKTFRAGKRTKTAVGVLYIEDIVDFNYVNEIAQRINELDIDGIVESGQLEKLLKTDKWEIFPSMGVVERSDKACAHLLKGKVCVLVEGSSLILSAPQTFIEYMDAGDDHYDNMYMGMFTKIMRIAAFFLPLVLSPLYISAVAFNPDILPASYILVLAVSRVTVPVNAVLEVVMMEIAIELLKEASIRLPKQIGTAMGIVGAIVIGQASVSAGLVSPLTVIIIALSTMATFAIPDQSVVNPIRVLKFLMIFITGVFGLFGFTIGMTFIITKMLSQESFGLPFNSPISPLKIDELSEEMKSNIALKNKKNPAN